MKNNFKDKTAIVTGGASGMGKEIVRILAKGGASVIIIDRDDTAGSKYSVQLSRRGYDVSFEHVDMLDAGAVERTFKAAAARYRRLDYVFNIAGSFMAGEIRDTPLSNWHEHVNENIFAIYNGAHHAYHIMLRQKLKRGSRGHILNMGSSAGLFPVPAMGIYGSTKYAIVGLSQAMRNEAKDLGVRVSAICPIIVNTPLYDAAIYNRLDKKKFLKSRHFVQQPRSAAKRIVKGMLRNQALIHTSVLTRFSWLMYRLSPDLYNSFARRAMRAYRKTLRTSK